MNEKIISIFNNFPFKGRAAKIIIAGGGTGGHIFPAIAIANALVKIDPRTEILFIGARGKMEMEKVPQAGYKIVGIPIAGFNRSSLIKNIGLPYKLIKSFLQVRNHFITFMPDAVIGVGGYSSFPVLRFAQLKGIPTFIHEANSFAGKSNMMLAKKATRIFVASDGMEKFFPANKTMITGNPVRGSIVKNNISREEAMKFFKLRPEKKTILSVGGSLGARSINEAIELHIGMFGQHDMQLIWQTGKEYENKAKEIVAGKDHIYSSSFIHRMDYAYAAADVVISRAGAMAIAELCVVKKPVVFVPYPFAAEDHQTSNAKHMEDKNAGMMIRDEDAKKELVITVIDLVHDEARQERMKENIKKLAIINADEIVAKEIIQALNT